MKVLDLLLEIAAFDQADIDSKKMGNWLWDEMSNNYSFEHTVMFEFIQDEGLEYADFEADPVQFREDYAEKFKAWFFTYYVESAIDAAWYNIRFKIKVDNGHLVLYRTITVNPTSFIQNLNTPNPRNLGIYWSYNADCSEAHWSQRSSGSIDLTLTGMVDPHSVDWTSTVFHNISMPEECEIRLIEGSPIRLISIDDLRKNSYNRVTGQTTPLQFDPQIFQRMYKA